MNKILRMFACLALFGTAAGGSIEPIQAQERATIYKPKQIPAAQSKTHALLWFRLAKHSDHTWEIKTKIGLGVLIGNVQSEQTETKVPLKKPLWPSVQIAPFDVDLNEFAGKGESKKAVARGQSKVFYIPVKRFVYEDENYRHYLVSVKSGNYVIGGTQSTCFCWGTKWFSVKAGSTYNMGTYYVATENGLSFWPDLTGFETADDLAIRGLIADTMRLAAPTSNDVMPDILAHFAPLMVSYEDTSNLGNHYGRLVNLMIPDDWQTGMPLQLTSASDATATEGASETDAEEVNGQDADDAHPAEASGKFVSEAIEDEDPSKE